MRQAVLSCWILSCMGHVHAADMPWVAIAKDKKGFVLEPTGKKFTPWGFNYDRDADGRLIEDYWDDEWPTVEAHLGQMKKLGANVVRVHLQLGKFMVGPDKANEKALDRLAKLLRLAEKERLYLDLTGLGCYHKKDVPAWYDVPSEQWMAWADGETGAVVVQAFSDNRLTEIKPPQWRKDASRLTKQGFDDCFFDEGGKFLWAVGPISDEEVEVQLIDVQNWNIVQQMPVEDRFGASDCSLHGTCNPSLVSLKWTPLSRPKKCLS